MPFFLASTLLVVALAWVAWLEDFDGPKWLVAALMVGIGGIAAVRNILRDGASDRATADRAFFWPSVAALNVALIATVSAFARDIDLFPGLVDAARLFIPIGAAFVASRIDAHDRRDRFVCLFGAAAPSLVIVAQWMMDHGHFACVPHAEGFYTATLGNTAFTGMFATAAVGFAVRLLFFPKRTAEFSAGCASTLATVLLIVRSDSRAAYLATAVFFAVLILFSALKKRRTATRHNAPDERMTSRRAVAGLVAILAIVACAGLLSGTARSGNLAAVAERFSSAGDTSHPTNRVRLEMWKASTTLWKSHPVFGLGGGRFGDDYPAVRPAAEWEISGPTSFVDHPHNEWIRFLVEYGIVGLCALSALIVFFAKRMLFVARSDDPRGSIDAAIGLAALAAFIVNATFWDAFNRPASVVFLGVLVGRAMRGGAASVVRRKLPPIVAMLCIAQLPIMLAAAYQDARFVAVREKTATAKRRVTVDQSAGRVDEATLAAVAAISDEIGKTVASPYLSTRRKHRLLLDLYDFALVRKLLDGAASRRGLESDERKGLENAASFFPTTGRVRELVSSIRRTSPSHFGLLLLELYLFANEGRMPEAFNLSDDVLAQNPATPLVRTETAKIVLAAGRSGADQTTSTTPFAPDVGLFIRAAELLAKEVELFGRRPEMDPSWDLLVTAEENALRIDRALAAVADWIAARGASVERSARGGQTTLLLGESAATTGRFIGLSESDAERSERGSLLRAQLEGADPEKRRLEFLAHLYEHPHDTPVLDGLERAIGELQKEQKSGESVALARERRRAIARSKILYGWDHHESGRSELFGRFVDLALRQDEFRSDAWFLAVLRDVEAGREKEAIDRLVRWKELGGSDFSFLALHPAGKALAGRPEVREILGEKR